MTIEKLKSGSYRIKQMYKGKYYSVVINHKPDKNEAVILLATVLKKKPSRNNQTFDDACEAYIDSKSNVLSPTTIRTYQITRKAVTEEFSQKHITMITTMDVQKEVNRWSAKLAPKTVKNYASFVISVLKAAEIDIKYVKLPQNVKKSFYIPSKDDIKKIHDQIKGTNFEIPFFLMCFGLRRSEVCALTIDDLDGTELSINKALVLDENKKWVIKLPKTPDSTRTIIIPKDLAKKIRKQGYIYNGTPDNLYFSLISAQKKAGVPRFKLHALRHFFASFMHDRGYSDKQIQEMGGWKTDVMKYVYQHALNMEQTKTKMSAEIEDIFVDKSVDKKS